MVALTAAWGIAKVIMLRGWMILAGIVRWLWNVKLPALLVVIALGVWLWTALSLHTVRKEVSAIEAKLNKTLVMLAECERTRNEATVMLDKAARAARECIGQRHAIDEATAEIERVRQAWVVNMQRELMQNRQERKDLYEAHNECHAIRDVPICAAVYERLQRLATD